MGTTPGKYTTLKLKNDLLAARLYDPFPMLRGFYDSIATIEDCLPALTELLSRLQKWHDRQIKENHGNE